MRDAPRPGDLPEGIWDVGCPWAYMHIENMKTLESVFRYMHVQVQININVTLPETNIAPEN